MTDPNNSPVSLPAGSYDATVLQRGLDKAAKGAISRYDENVGKAVLGARQFVEDGAPAVADQRETPGYRWREVENEELGVTERIQVFDPELAEQQGVTGENPQADLINNQAKVTADAASKVTSTEKE